MLIIDDLCRGLPFALDLQNFSLFTVCSGFKFNLETYLLFSKIDPVINDDDNKVNNNLTMQ
jgi:hypothetical protein